MSVWGKRVLAAVRSMPLLPSLVLLVALLAAAGADAVVGVVLPGTGTLDLPARYSPPWPLDGATLTHPLGADRLGRDVLSRVIIGTRLSLEVGLVVVVLGGGIGTLAGLVAGFISSWISTVIMRLMDLMLSFPAILVALVLVVVIGPSFWMVTVVLALHTIPQFARVIRAEVLVWRERGFVVWSRAAGTPWPLILLIHILPNVLNSVIVLGTLQIGWVILAEAGLSFLGAGIPPPTPTLGNLLAEGRDTLDQAWWLTVLPGLDLTLLVLAFNLFGDWLRDSLDPRLRQLAP